MHFKKRAGKQAHACECGIGVQATLCILAVKNGFNQEEATTLAHHKPQVSAVDDHLLNHEQSICAVGDHVVRWNPSVCAVDDHVLF